MEERLFPVIDRRKTGQRIGQYMMWQGLSVEEVRKYLGLGSVQSVYHWLEGKTMPSVDNLYALCRLLGTTMDCIVCGEDEEQGGYESCEKLRISQKRRITWYGQRLHAA